jgi:hypothetical protein
MKVRATLDAPLLQAAHYNASAFLSAAEEFARLARKQIPAIPENVVLESVEVGSDLTADTVTPGTDDVAGGAAGAHVATGILATSQLVTVWQVTNIATDAGPPDVADITEEFTVTDDDEIDNTGGTDTTGSVLIVSWVDVTAA